MDTFTTVVRFFQDGGMFMYPIAIVMVLGFAIALERWLFLRRTGRQNRDLWSELLPLMDKGDFDRAERLAQNSETAIGRVLGYGFARSRTHTARADVESAMEESLMEVTPLLEKRTPYLATFANIATLLGLLGTIIGLIQGFTAISAASPAEKADQLSASISVAMNTTAFGLMVAIPLLLLHAWLSTKTTELVDSLETAAVKFLNTLSHKNG